MKREEQGPVREEGMGSHRPESRQVLTTRRRLSTGSIAFEGTQPRPMNRTTGGNWEKKYLDINHIHLPLDLLLAPPIG